MTREEIEKDMWLGDQRGKVLGLLDRAERAERIAKQLRDKAIFIVDRAAPQAFSNHPMADSDIRSDLGREIFAIWQGKAP